MKRGYKLLVQDILDCIQKIDQFIGEMTLEQFISDDKTFSAVLRKLEIIGEASKNIPQSRRAKHPELP